MESSHLPSSSERRREDSVKPAISVYRIALFSASFLSLGSRGGDAEMDFLSNIEREDYGEPAALNNSSFE